MPVKIPDGLPARAILNKENIFVMDEHRAAAQDIRPLRIAILNLMPTKIETEIQFLRLIGNTALQVEVDLIHPVTYTAKNTPLEYLLKFYKTFAEIKDEKYDGMIITGAPVEHLEFEQVAYWDELCEIMTWTKTHVTSTIHICWGAQAGLYYHYGIPKYSLGHKCFGIFNHQTTEANIPLLRGFDDSFAAPHSRNTEIRSADVEQVDDLMVLADSVEAGVYIVARKDGQQVFVTGHAEYDPWTLRDEYERDVKKGLKTAIPVNYFRNDMPKQPPVVTWRGHANLLFSNWLNYYVYQVTPFSLYD